MKIGWALSNLYREVLKKGCKVRVLRGPIEFCNGYKYELETYIEGSHQTKCRYYRHFLYSDRGMIYFRTIE